MAGHARAVFSAGRDFAKTATAKASLWVSIVTATRTAPRVFSASRLIAGLGTTPVPSSEPPTRSALRMQSAKLALTVGMRAPRTLRKTTRIPCSAFRTTRSPPSLRSPGKMLKAAREIGRTRPMKTCCTMASTASMALPTLLQSTAPSALRLTRSSRMVIRSIHPTSVNHATTKSHASSSSTPRLGMEHLCLLKVRLSPCLASALWTDRQVSVHRYWALKTMLRAPHR